MCFRDALEHLISPVKRYYWRRQPRIRKKLACDVFLLVISEILVKLWKHLPVNKKYVFLILLPIILSCHWAAEKGKQTVNKAGEVVAKAGSEFTQGVSKGVEKTFKNEVLVSDDLKSLGLMTGKITVLGTDSTIDNILSVYFIFDKDFNERVMVRVISEEGDEYGRTTEQINGRQADTRYVDFIFDKRTNIDSKGKILFSLANSK